MLTTFLRAQVEALVDPLPAARQRDEDRLAIGADPPTLPAPARPGDQVPPDHGRRRSGSAAARNCDGDSARARPLGGAFCIRWPQWHLADC